MIAASTGGSNMKNETSGFLIVAALLLSPFAVAQDGAPKPTAEHKRLGYFVGTWHTEGEMKPGPMGPGGKTTATDRCSWFEGGFAVVCQSDGTSVGAPMKGIGILS